MIHPPPERDPQPPDGPDPATGSERWDFDPTAAFLAGDYVELCPRCGRAASGFLAGQHSCGHCGAVWPDGS